MASQGPAWVRLIMPSRLARARSICAAGCEIRAAQATHAWVAQLCRLSSQKERRGGDGLGAEPSCVLYTAFRPHGGAFGRPSTRKRDLQQFPRLRIDLRASSAQLCRLRGPKQILGVTCWGLRRSNALFRRRRTWMEDTGGKSGRRSERHLQVDASGLGDAASVQCRLVGRVGGKRCDLEVTGWGLGRPTACVLQSRSRRGLRRIGAEPGPENAPSAIFSVAGGAACTHASGDQRAQS